LNFSTPRFISRFFYFGFHWNCDEGEEFLGISIFNLYAGIYVINKKEKVAEFCFGLLDFNESL
jgi:hypothetical protein